MKHRVAPPTQHLLGRGDHGVGHVRQIRGGVKGGIQGHLAWRDRGVEPRQLGPGVEQINRVQPRLNDALEQRGRERDVVPGHLINQIGEGADVVPKRRGIHAVGRRDELEQQRLDQRVNVEPLIADEVDRGDWIHADERGLVPGLAVDVEGCNGLAGPGVLGGKGLAAGFVDRHAQHFDVAIGRILLPVVGQRVEHHVVVVAGRPAILAQEVGADRHVFLGGDAGQPDRHAGFGALEFERERVDVLNLGPGRELDGREQEALVQIALQDRRGVGVLRVVVVIEEIDDLLRGAALQDHDLKRADDSLEHHVGAWTAAKIELR